jgi:hypothetical protein
MKGVLPWLVRRDRYAGTIYFYPALAVLVSPVQNITSHRTLFHFISLHRPATWTTSRARSPVSLSLDPASNQGFHFVWLSPLHSRGILDLSLILCPLHLS